MKRVTKKLSVAVAVLLIAAFALCALFVVTEAEHNCCDAGCSICAGIANCLNVLNTHACRTGGCVSVPFFTLSAVPVLGAVMCGAFSTSLVTLKIKLSD